MTNGKAVVLCDRLAVSGGATVGAFGTAVDLVLPTWARAIMGLVVLGVDETTTAAEGKATILRVNSKSLGITNEEFLTGPFVTSGPATNNDGQSNVAEVIPLDISTGGGETMSIDCAPTGTSTGVILYEIGVLVSNNPAGIPKDWLDKFPNTVAFRGGKAEQASQTTTTRTALTAIRTPSWAEAIVAYKAAVIKNGAITTAEEGLGYFELGNTMSLSPILLPSVFGTGAALGTPAGGHGQYANRVPYVPIYIPLSGKQETWTPYIVLRTAVTTANRVDFALAWR